MTKEELSIKIAKYRTANKICQNELAAKLGVSQPTVAAWEAGRSYPHGDKLEILHNLFEQPDLVTENKQLKSKVFDLSLMVDFLKAQIEQYVGRK